MSDRPPTYAGPEPLPLPKLTKLDVPTVSDTPSGIHRALTTFAKDISKAKRSSRFKLYGGVGTVLLALLGGGKLVRAQGESIETKHARLEEKQAATAKAVDDLKTRVDAGEKLQQHTALKVERVEALLELELDMRGVPKSKRPPPVPEPKGDEP